MDSWNLKPENIGKRPHVVSGTTPNKPPKKVSGKGSLTRRKLFSSPQQKVNNQSIKPNPWSTIELKELVKYVALYSENSVWPTHKNEYFWEQCSKAVSEAGGNNRSGAACRDKVIRVLKPKFPTLEHAEEEFGIDYVNDEDAKVGSFKGQPLNHSPCKYLHDEYPAGQLMELMTSSFTKLTRKQRSNLLYNLFELHLIQDFQVSTVRSYVSTAFLDLCGHAIKNLQMNNKENILLDLAKCLQLSKDGVNHETRMSLNKMPFGMIAYNCKFFSSEWSGNIRIPDDYMSWMMTMYTYFGNPWASLHLGPHWCHDEISREATSYVKPTSSANKDLVSLALAMGDVDLSNCDTPEDHETSPLIPPVSTLWSGISQSDASEIAESALSPCVIEKQFEVRPQIKYSGGSIEKDPLTAKVNIAGPSPSTIRRKIAQSGFVRSTEIQYQALKMAHENNRQGRWWIKADATDMQKGLRESMKREWYGDVDMGDGRVQELHAEYIRRLEMVQELGKGSRKNVLQEDLNYIKETLEDEVVSLKKGEIDAQHIYDCKRKQKNVNEESLFALAWEVDGYVKLIQRNHQIGLEIATILQDINTSSKKLFLLQKELTEYIKGVSTKKREMATHLLIFMISDEQRNKKPYAIPVRILTYKSITDGQLRELTGELKDAMEKMGMVVVGLSTDGEFNSLRTMGTNRATSVIQLAMDSKLEARSTRVGSIKQYLTPRVVGCNIEPLQHHPAIPIEDVKWIWDFINDQERPSTFSRAIHILRRKHYPFSHNPEPWIPGKDETESDCMKSLMAMYLYRYKVKAHVSNGVDFRSHLYVPDGTHDREDHNHLLKRIGTCTTAGTIPTIDIRHFVEALKDPKTGLTYTALTGQRKQSVPDVERIFSPAMVRHMEENGHQAEATFVRTVCNWHKANDGRGLTEAERSHYNFQMLNLILDDWMPWHTHDRDFSKIDINRAVKGICGFTREVIVGLSTNIESRELRRRVGEATGLPPEHPRASSTDDVEGLISILHRILGKTFDLKTFMDSYPKIVNEFTKKIDPDLPFYYWTGSDSRFNIGPLPSFNQPSDSGIERLDKVKISSRADPAMFVASRASLPQRGSLSIRATFHNPPERLPPPNMCI